MTKYLTVTYYPDKHTAKLANRWDDGNAMPGDSIDIAYSSKIMFVSSFGNTDIDIGDYDNFRGTYQEFNENVINELAQYNHITGMTYSAIGRLLIILDNFPDDYNYIIIENQ